MINYFIITLQRLVYLVILILLSVEMNPKTSYLETWEYTEQKETMS